MPDNYAVIPEFGQLVEYITQVAPDANGFYDIKINTVPLATYDLAGIDSTRDVNLTLRNVLEDFVKVLRIKIRTMDLTAIDFSGVIPNPIRIRINAWLTARGWTNVPSGWTYRQLFVAIKARL
jgi:hypothetical protein